MLEKVKRVILKNRTKKCFMRRVAIHYGRDTADYALINSAYELARKEFRGILRHSGEPYFYHKLAVAVILMEYLEIHHDANLIAAALLHDLLEDVPSWTQKRLATELNDDVARLVLSVTKPDVRLFKNRQKFDEGTFAKVRMYGLRSIKLKLGDRLHNMITLWCEPQKAIAKTLETLQYVLPMAVEANILWQELTVACAEELQRHRDIYKSR